MNLAELEQKAREQREADNEAAAQEEAAEKLAEQEKRENFRQEIIAWMVQEGDLCAQELEAMLGVMDTGRINQLCLNVPEHQSIIFVIEKKDGNWRVRNDRFDVERPNDPSWPHSCYSLGEALIDAAWMFRNFQESEAEREKREAERHERAERERQEALERGQRYLDLLDDYPVLRPVLDILGLFLEDREHFAEDLYMAEEFTAGVEARMGEKLEQAQHEADRYARERDDLQRDLYDAQDKVRELGRKGRRGW